MEVRTSNVGEFFAHEDCAKLLAVYAEECANRQLPPPNPNRKLYQAMEDAGMFFLIAAFEGRVLLGFVALLVAQNPHYGVPIATAESLFVAREYRAYGVGLSLLREARTRAEELGAHGLYVSAPVDSSLVDILPAIGFRKTNEVFFAGFP